MRIFLATGHQRELESHVWQAEFGVGRHHRVDIQLGRFFRMYSYVHLGGEVWAKAVYVDRYVAPSNHFVMGDGVLTCLQLWAGLLVESELEFVREHH